MAGFKDQGPRDKEDRYRFLRWWEWMDGGERVMSGRKGSKKGVINVYT